MQHRLEEACVKHSPRTPLTIGASTGMLWNYEHRLAYCPNAKTGTTTWMNILLELVPWLGTKSRDCRDGNSNCIYYAALQFFQMPKWKWPGGKALFDRLFSFVFVRHPFVRLVSAYQDKVWARKYNMRVLCDSIQIMPEIKGIHITCFNSMNWFLFADCGPRKV